MLQTHGWAKKYSKREREFTFAKICETQQDDMKCIRRFSRR